MSRYRERIPLNSINVQYVSDEIVKNMQSLGFTFVNYKGQGLWKKECKNRWRPFAPPMRVHIGFCFYHDYVVLEAFILWKILLSLDSPECGLDDGIIGIILPQKNILRDQINQVREVIYSFI